MTHLLKLNMTCRHGNTTRWRVERRVLDGGEGRLYSTHTPPPPPPTSDPVQDPALDVRGTRRLKSLLVRGRAIVPWSRSQTVGVVRLTLTSGLRILSDIMYHGFLKIPVRAVYLRALLLSVSRLSARRSCQAPRYGNNMNAPCARCKKTVYPMEKLSCLDKVRRYSLA